ncbi:MAG: glutathione S-transferase family protein [Mariprofundaceae bacterium]|nr:glutathione S-transferase family protein [Mariprofundaceae bacterium]
MGLLINGKWRDEWYDTKSTGGRFERSEAQFCRWTGQPEFPAESGRYHLYVCYACPWAHRTLIFRMLKGLEQHIGVTATSPDMLENGWEYAPHPEPLYGFRFHHQLYTKADPHYSGRVTVPVLWDKKNETIVSNESADIIRMFNSAFDHITGNRNDYYPESLRSQIDEINAFVYDHVNNGVYKCGFATTQEAYEEAYDALFAALDELEARLSRQRYLLGNRITEADWRLFTTLVRFDVVYHGHFKCNRNRIVDMPSLSGYLKDLYQQPGIAGTVHFDHIKRHYYYSHESINPTRIIPRGPRIELDAPHDRERFA